MLDHEARPLEDVLVHEGLAVVTSPQDRKPVVSPPNPHNGSAPSSFTQALKPGTSLPLLRTFSSVGPRNCRKSGRQRMRCTGNQGRSPVLLILMLLLWAGSVYVADHLPQSILWWDAQRGQLVIAAGCANTCVNLLLSTLANSLLAVKTNCCVFGD